MDFAILRSDSLKALSGVRKSSQAVVSDEYVEPRMSSIKASDTFDILSGLGEDSISAQIRRDFIGRMAHEIARSAVEKSGAVHPKKKRSTK